MLNSATWLVSTPHRPGCSINLLWRKVTDANPMPAVTPGRVCLTVTALTTSIGPFIADWNETHVKNPKWPPHARFHNGQTMSTGLALGLLTLHYTWRPSPFNAVESLRTAAILGSVYGATAISGIMYPGALAIDPEFGEGFPQLPLFLGMTGLPWIGYLLDLRRLKKWMDENFEKPEVPRVAFAEHAAVHAAFRGKLRRSHFDPDLNLQPCHKALCAQQWSLEWKCAAHNRLCQTSWKVDHNVKANRWNVKERLVSQIRFSTQVPCDTIGLKGVYCNYPLILS